MIRPLPTAPEGRTDTPYWQEAVRTVAHQLHRAGIHSVHWDAAYFWHEAVTRLRVSDLELLVGGQLGTTSKIPGFSYGLSVRTCRTGSLMMKCPGTICSTCYAATTATAYNWPGVQRCLVRRFQSLDKAWWVAAMSELIRRKYAKNSKRTRTKHFRWHDTGDLQTIGHLRQIVEVCRNNHSVMFWLPTKEYGIIAQWTQTGNTLPSNLIVRLSGVNIDGPPPRIGKLLTSTVHDAKAPRGHSCPAAEHHSSCDAFGCRACWDPRVKNVSYALH